MDYLSLTIPARENAALARIRPREVRGWLDDLPYLDVARAARLASRRLRLLNRQSVAPALRLDVLSAFLGAYHRLEESTPAADLVSVGPLLKRLCQDLGFGYKIVVHELSATGLRLLDRRSLPAAVLGALHVLGMQLMHCYVAYQPAPRALWKECLALYRYARSTGRHGYRAPLPGVGETGLEARFREIALLGLADPYRLAPGMAAALGEYLKMHVELAHLQADPAGGGVWLALDADQARGGRGADKALSLNVARLIEQMQKDSRSLQRHRRAEAIGLPGSVAARALEGTLEQVLRDWQTPRSRGAERAAAYARIDMVAGLEAVYCVLNGGRGFDPALFPAFAVDEVIDLGRRPAPERQAPAAPPAAMRCVTLNRSSGGVALSCRGQVLLRPAVGQLMGLRRADGAGGWVLAVCRWLRDAGSEGGFDIGLQYLAREARAVAVRIADGPAHECAAALLVTHRRGQQPMHSLIAAAGRLVPASRVMVYEPGREYPLHCAELVESGTGFDRFRCQTT